MMTENDWNHIESILGGIAWFIFIMVVFFG